ncbi:FecR protein [compost metagenome]
MERPSQETMIRFFRGTIPPEEKRAVSIYLAMNIDGDYVDDCFRKAFPDFSIEHDNNIPRQELDRVWNKLEAGKQYHSNKQLKLRLRWHAYAAVIAFLIVSSACLFLFNNEYKSNHPVEIGWQKISAVPGGIKRVKLMDNSEITLFPGSTVEVPDNFNRIDRSIRMTGRAFFKVSHNAEKPFYVRSGSMTTKVLGTSFEVNTAGMNPENTIILHTGKISVSLSGTEIARLHPNQKISLNKSTGKYNVVNLKASGTSSWLSGELDYDQVTLKTVIGDLEQWYGVKISTEGSLLLSRKVTFGFKELPLTTVLNMLSKSAGFTYVITGKQILIKERSMEKN